MAIFSVSCQLLPEGSMVVQQSYELVRIQLSGNKHWTGKEHQLDPKSAGVTSYSEKGRLQATKWVTVGLIVTTLQVIPAIQTMDSVTQSYSQTAMFYSYLSHVTEVAMLWVFCSHMSSISVHTSEYRLAVSVKKLSYTQLIIYYS
jgi:hypothetical protein